MGDDGRSMCFETNCMNSIWVNDGDTFYTLEELKALANDGMPKQGDENVSGKEAKVTIDGKEYSVTLKLI